MSSHPQYLTAIVPPEESHRREGDVLLVASAPYHLDELVPLARALMKRGVTVTLAAFEPPVGPLVRFRSQTRLYRRIIELVGEQGFQPQYPSLPIPELTSTHQSLVVMNDWGWHREQVLFAHGRGIPTFGKVEGVQDFADLDTGRTRHPYRTVNYVLFQGENDAHSLKGCRGSIVGNCRIERVLAKPPADPDRDLVVINSNFTYNVLTEHRNAWLASAIKACRSSGRRYVISRHRADRGWIHSRQVSRRPVEELLDEAGVLVTRFSTLGFEALARGIELVYHNPHGERVPTFQEPRGAFAVTRSAEELAATLRTLPGSPPVRERAAAFLSAQIDVDPARPSSERAADTVLRVLRSGA